jgi:co-chaperonin GroES (HSP10)
MHLPRGLPRIPLAVCINAVRGLRGLKLRRELRMNSGSGDKLASGQKSAQFFTSGSTANETIELLNVAPEEEQDITNGVKVIDKRSAYNSEPVKKAEPKWPEKTYETFSPILDRLLVKRIAPDKNMELLEDGSIRDKRTGFVIPAKYRQHANIGVVLAVGEFMVMGGIKIPLSDIVKPGYRVMFGEYNAEKLKVPDEQVMAMCDAVRVEFEASEDLDVVRVQDIRGIYRPKEF